MQSVPCRFCGVRIYIIKMSVNVSPVKWRRTNEVDGRDHVCVKKHLLPQQVNPGKDTRYEIVKCVKCYEEGVGGLCLNWSDWINHRLVYGCTEFERWSYSWLYPERHSEKLEEKRVILIEVN